jgi:hypothetical protein
VEKFPRDLDLSFVDLPSVTVFGRPWVARVENVVGSLLSAKALCLWCWKTAIFSWNITSRVPLIEKLHLKYQNSVSFVCLRKLPANPRPTAPFGCRTRCRYKRGAEARSEQSKRWDTMKLSTKGDLEWECPCSLFYPSPLTTEINWIFDLSLKEILLVMMALRGNLKG